jgi:AcrR family transcriptional regulator
MDTGDTYHHGDLRRALMEGALACIRDSGLEGLSLRRVASAAGVSHTAPYHHFESKGELVRALGYEGLGRLDERMGAAEAEAGGDPLERLLAIGAAYVTFAVDRPDYYAAMRAPEMAQPHAGGAVEEHGESWERLVRAVVACQGTGSLPAGDPTVLAVGMWSLVHGLAELWATSPIPALPAAARGCGPFTEAVLRAMVRVGAAD